MLTEWNHLQQKQPHSDKSQPGVNAVEMGDGISIAILVCPKRVIVPGCKEAQNHTGDGKYVEEGV